MSYGKRIAAIVPTHEPRHVEAVMRVIHPTLDHLSAEEFAFEARVAAATIDAWKRSGQGDVPERLAETYGLGAKLRLSLRAPFEA